MQMTGAGVYAVLGRRRARIVREELREGSGHFSVHAFLPMQARLVHVLAPQEARLGQEDIVAMQACLARVLWLRCPVQLMTSAVS